MCGRFHVDGDDEDLQEILNEINRRLIEKFGEKASDIGEARAGGDVPDEHCTGFDFTTR